MGTSGSGTDEESATANEYFSALYTEQYSTLLRVAFLLTGSHEAAEDAVQDAFIRCRPHLAGLDHPPSYLRTAVVNRCRSVYRRSALQDSDPPILPSELPNDLIELHDALSRLAWRPRAAIVLRYFVDIPDNQIADILECRPPTVRTLIRRGVATLRKELS